MKITYYGHSALLVETGNVKVIIDPFCQAIRTPVFHLPIFPLMPFCLLTATLTILEMLSKLPNRMIVRSLRCLSLPNIAG